MSPVVVILPTASENGYLNASCFVIDMKLPLFSYCKYKRDTMQASQMA